MFVNERRLLAMHLKRLRLPTILAECEKLAQEAAQESAHYLQYLPHLVELESAQRCAHGRHPGTTISPIAYPETNRIMPGIAGATPDRLPTGPQRPVERYGSSRLP